MNKILLFVVAVTAFACISGAPHHHPPPVPPPPPPPSPGKFPPPPPGPKVIPAPPPHHEEHKQEEHKHEEHKHEEHKHEDHHEHQEEPHHEEPHHEEHHQEEHHDGHDLSEGSHGSVVQINTATHTDKKETIVFSGTGHQGGSSHEESQLDEGLSEHDFDVRRKP